jgi:hypothetical protein
MRRSIKDSARTASKQAKPIRTEYNLENCPKGKIVRGFSDSDKTCNNCQSIDECKSITLKRILTVMDDLNKKLLHDDPFSFYDGETSYWNLVEGPLSIDGKWLDELREEIKTKIQDWYKDQEEDDSDTIQEDVAKLNKATVRVLDNIWPEWKKWTGQFIDKKHVTDTENLEKLKLCLRIPFYIMDSYMNKMSASAWKVFSYIARCATFDPGNNHFGRCWLSYEDIQERTGVKTIQKYVNELEALKLLDVEHTRRFNKYNQCFGTTNQFTISWFGNFKKLGVDGYVKMRNK